MDVKKLSMTTTVENNKNLFEDVAKDYNKAKDVFRVQYSILNYDKIINELISYLDGYKKYADEGSDKYKGKVLSISRSFFDKMFSDKEYRKKINLSEFRENNFNYLKRIDNQFKKLAKVNRDDMKIYLWIVNADSKFFAYHLDQATRKAYYDKTSPVMHKVVKK